MVVGLTGGIACGKSTVASFFQELGMPVVDADALAREVVAPGSPGLAAVVERFGVEILRPDGSLDRAALGARVFKDDEARAALEQVTHPRIAALGMERIADFAQQGAPLVLYEAALLVEKGLQKNFAALVVVTTSEATQLTRLMARDGSSEQDALERMRAQLPLADKVRVADFVIENDGSTEHTRAEVVRTHSALLEHLGLPSSGDSA